MLKWLNNLGEKKLQLTGEGSFVKGIAAKNKENIQIYLVNYDPNDNHYETVPIIIKNLIPGKYLVIKEVFQGNKDQSKVIITQGTWTGQVTMSPNETVRLTLKPT